MTFAYTRDFAVIREVLTHPTQYRMASEDATPPAHCFAPNEDARIWYVEARDGHELLGIFSFLPQNSVCYEVHAALLPRAWGARTRAALKGALAFIWSTTFNLNMGAGIPRVVCAIPAYNRLAIRLAKDAGFRAFGRNPRSFQRHGELHDQILLGINRD